MKASLCISLARLAFLPVTLAAVTLAPARAEIIHQFVPLPYECPQMVWFHAMHLEQVGASGHSGMLPLGMEAYATPGFPPALWGGWFSWTGQGAYLSYAGGAISTTDIHHPGGGAITDVRGATYLASALDVRVENTDGDIQGVTLYSGLLFWTPSHLYLLLVGGPPTVYEVTAPGGAPIAGVRGVARLGAQIIDMDDSMSVNAVLWSGALVYTDTQLFLTRTHTVVSTTEITSGGSAIGGVRGVLPMGGNANPIKLDAGAYVWTRLKTFQFLSDGTTSIAEVLDPFGASLSNTWGMSRQGRPWSGFGSYSGSATLFGPTKQYFLTTLGSVNVTEVISETGTPIRSDVKIAGNNAMLHQGGGMSEVYALRAPPGGSSQRGTVIALGQ